MGELRAIEGMLGHTLKTEDLEGFDYQDRSLPSPKREAKKVVRLVYNGRARSGWGGRRRRR